MFKIKSISPKFRFVLVYLCAIFIATLLFGNRDYYSQYGQLVELRFIYGPLPIARLSVTELLDSPFSFSEKVNLLFLIINVFYFVALYKLYSSKYGFLLYLLITVGIALTIFGAMSTIIIS